MTFRRKKPGIESDAVQFMTEFARYLIEAGVSSRRFERIVRMGYFLAASRAARFSNKRINQSAVAAMTGLTRVQVRQFAKQARAMPISVQDRLDQLIEGWTTDAAFLKASSLPRRLRLGGQGRNFPALVRRYGGDVPPRSILRELQRHGLVTVRGGYVSLATGKSLGKAEYRLNLISRSLARLLDNAECASAPVPLKAINLEVSFPAPSDVGKVLLHKRAEDGLRVFLSGVREMACATARGSKTLKGKKLKVARARVVLITEELES